MQRLVEVEQISFEEESNEQSLRPSNWDDYIGQEKIKKNLRVFIDASRKRAEALDHILFYGPPGLGKTTLSYLSSNEMNSTIKITAGPMLEKSGDLAAILTNLEEGDILFIDEIHRLSPAVEEILYPAMEDYALDIIVGKGPSARSLRIDLEKFTLVGATTRSGQLTSPLRDRFGVMLNLELYKVEDLSKIVKRSASVLKVDIDEEGALEIARRSRGTPRIANRLLKRVRDYAQVMADGNIVVEVAKDGLNLLEIDNLGLDSVDRKIIKTLIYNFKGGPVGVDTIAASTGEERITIEDVYEPYLLQLGFLSRTSRGRILTAKAYEHFGLKHNE